MYLPNPSSSPGTFAMARSIVIVLSCFGVVCLIIAVVCLIIDTLHSELRDIEKPAE